MKRVLLRIKTITFLTGGVLMLALVDVSLLFGIMGVLCLYKAGQYDSLYQDHISLLANDLWEMQQAEGYSSEADKQASFAAMLDENYSLRDYEFYHPTQFDPSDY